MSVAKSTANKAIDLPGFEAVWERLKEVTGWRSQAELASRLGLTSPSVTDAKRRGTFPLNWAYALSIELDVSLDYLLGRELTGEESAQEKKRRPIEPRQAVHNAPAKSEQEIDHELARGNVIACSDCEIMMVPMVNARLSAGGGSLETTGEVTGRYAFRTQFLRRKGNTSSMVLMRVTGDSMEPDIWSGDTVLIDKSQTRIIAGGIYAVGIDEEVVIKNVDKLPGKIVLRSKNKDYDPIEVSLDGDLADGVRIIGRVIWWCREAR